MHCYTLFLELRLRGGTELPWRRRALHTFLQRFYLMAYLPIFSSAVCIGKLLLNLKATKALKICQKRYTEFKLS